MAREFNQAEYHDFGDQSPTGSKGEKGRHSMGHQSVNLWKEQYLSTYHAITIILRYDYRWWNEILRLKYPRKLHSLLFVKETWVNGVDLVIGINIKSFDQQLIFTSSPWWISNGSNFWF